MSSSAAGRLIILTGPFRRHPRACTGSAEPVTRSGSGASKSCDLSRVVAAVGQRDSVISAPDQLSPARPRGDVIRFHPGILPTAANEATIASAYAGTQKRLLLMPHRARALAATCSDP